MGTNKNAVRTALSDIIALASLGIGLLTAWLYAAGWTYAYYYFDLFRVPLLLLDIPLQHLLVYGSLVVAKDAWEAAIVFLLLAGIWSAFRRWPLRFGSVGAGAVVTILVITLFAIARLGAIAAAREDFSYQRSKAFPAFPRIHLALQGENAIAAKALGDILTGDCGRLLAATKDDLLLIRPIANAPSTDLDTFVIARSQLAFVRILSDSETCP